LETAFSEGHFQLGEAEIDISRTRLNELQENDCKPSKMYGATRVFELVEEIKNTKI